MNTNQMSLFAPASEKGSREWSLFSGVREDRTAGMFRVQQPIERQGFAVTTIKRAARPQSLFFKPGTQH